MPRTRNPRVETVVGGLGDPSPYLLADERVVVAVRRHILVLLTAFLETIGFIVGALMIQVLLSYVPVVRTLTLLIMLAAVVRLCYLILEWRLERFVITDQRMMLVGGVLTRQVAVMPMRKVTDLTFEKPLPGQVFGYGTFIVESAGQDQALSRIEFLPRANRLYLNVSDLLFGRASELQQQDPDLVVDPVLRGGRRTPAGAGAIYDPPTNEYAHDPPVNEHSSGRYQHGDLLASDLQRTDPQLGEKLAGLDYEASPDEFWAARLGGFPADGSETPGGVPQASLFDALKAPQPASARLRERLGGLNGRGRRRDDTRASPGPIEQRG